MHFRLTCLGLLGVVTLMTTAPVRADIWECEDPGGNKRFTNIKLEAKGCKQLTVTPNVMSPQSPGAKSGTPSQQRPQGSSDGFPKVAPQVQQQRDNDRRKILETELANEDKLLQSAKRDLAEQEGIRNGDERRNYQRVLDRLDPYQKKVKLHEDNIVNLQKELANLR